MISINSNTSNIYILKIEWSRHMTGESVDWPRALITQNFEIQHWSKRLPVKIQT